METVPGVGWTNGWHASETAKTFSGLVNFQLERKNRSFPLKRILPLVIFSMGGGICFNYILWPSRETAFEKAANKPFFLRWSVTFSVDTPNSWNLSPVGDLSCLAFRNLTPRVSVSPGPPWSSLGGVKSPAPYRNWDRVQGLCESRGGRPNEPYGFCGRKATLNHAYALVTVCP